MTVTLCKPVVEISELQLPAAIIAATAYKMVRAGFSRHVNSTKHCHCELKVYILHVNKNFNGEGK